ncbi:hypothetical protein E2542_SST00264 [Spatholobus suberectus]|nr:hypothetical protein E2542_SST00264 [Spatholobus suberectus]
MTGTYGKKVALGRIGCSSRTVEDFATGSKKRRRKWLMLKQRRQKGFPSKKLEAIRLAAALYLKLDSTLIELQNWNI